jgi:hypothetical protein
VTHEPVKREVQAVSHSFRQQLDVSVEQGDGAVTRQVISNSTLFVDGADETYQEGGKRLRSRGSKGLIENLS